MVCQVGESKPIILDDAGERKKGLENRFTAGSSIAWCAALNLSNLSVLNAIVQYDLSF